MISLVIRPSLIKGGRDLEIFAYNDGGEEYENGIVNCMGQDSQPMGRIDVFSGFVQFLYDGEKWNLIQATGGII